MTSAAIRAPGGQGFSEQARFTRCQPHVLVCKATSTGNRSMAVEEGGKLCRGGWGQYY